jgi:hypothetical protein
LSAAVRGPSLAFLLNGDERLHDLRRCDLGDGLAV